MSFLDLCEENRTLAKNFRTAGEALADYEDRQALVASALGQINERYRQPQLSQAELAEAAETVRLKKLYDTFPRQRTSGLCSDMVPIGNAESALEFRKAIESSNAPLGRLLPG